MVRVAVGHHQEGQVERRRLAEDAGQLLGNRARVAVAPVVTPVAAVHEDGDLSEATQDAVAILLRPHVEQIEAGQNRIGQRFLPVPGVF